jgi:hypothetical protein
MSLMQINVYNLSTAECHTFSAPSPAEAVRNAFAQVGKRDFNADGYGTNYPIDSVHVGIADGDVIFSLGEFAAVATRDDSGDIPPTQ